MYFSEADLKKQDVEEEIWRFKKLCGIREGIRRKNGEYHLPEEIKSREKNVKVIKQKMNERNLNDVHREEFKLKLKELMEEIENFSYKLEECKNLLLNLKKG